MEAEQLASTQGQHVRELLEGKTQRKTRHGTNQKRLAHESALDLPLDAGLAEASSATSIMSGLGDQTAAQDTKLGRERSSQMTSAWVRAPMDFHASDRIYVQLTVRLGVCSMRTRERPFYSTCIH